MMDNLARKEKEAEMCSCGHEHSHEKQGACGCGHEHSHEKQSACGCGHEHGHKEHDSCSCGHEHHGSRAEIRSLLIGAAFFVAAMIVRAFLGETQPVIVLGAFIVAYLVLGFGVLREAVENVSRGAVFDENFLMAIATIGAFLIGEYVEGTAVMLFYRAGEFFEHKAVERSHEAIREAVDLRPDRVLRERGGAVEEVSPESVDVGDVLVLRPGDRIALDGTVVEGESTVDTSPVTGEPVPVRVGPGSAMVSGGINLSGAVHMRVEKPLEEATATRIMNAVENAAASKPKVDRFITRFARVYTPVVCVLALLVAVVAPLLGLGMWKDWIYRALMFLMASCPCAIVLSIPLTFFAGIGRGGKFGILFKGGVTIEALSAVKNVVLDKTGTVTRGEFAVQAIRPADGEKEENILRVAAAAETHSTHPVAGSLREAARQRNLTLCEPLAVEEIAGRGVRASLPEGEVLVGSEKLLAEHGVGFDGARGDSSVCVALGGKFLGRIVIADSLKSDAREGIARLGAMGLHTVMLTGDAPEPAQEICRELGIGSFYARLLPDEKLERLRQVQREKGPSMFVGDGINDAPVLAGADVGAAMGAGADAAIEAADVVFMNNSVSSIAEAVAIARKTRAIAWQNTVFAIAVKVIVLVLGVLGLASMWWAVFADVGVTVLCVLNALRLMGGGKNKSRSA